MLAGPFPENLADDIVDSDGFQNEDDFQELGSDADLLLESIKDPIDRLYQVSTWVRNPSPRFASSKALHHQELDVESNVDLIQAFADFDYDYVSSVFLQHQKNKALKDGSEPQPPIQEAQHNDDDKVWEPIQPALLQHRSEVLKKNESFLVHRIARANGRRRQQFFYWRKHREKLSQHSNLATQHIEHSEKPQHKEVPTALSVTTASRLQKSHLTIKSGESQAPVSEYAPSTSYQNQQTVNFPPAPKEPSGEEFFECPYCFTLCSKAILGQKAWK